MSEPFNAFRYIYPPRTEQKIPLDGPVTKIWAAYPDAVAQLKLNGTRNLIYVFPDSRIEFWNRHKELQKYAIPENMRAAILSITPPGSFTVWDTELLHFKTKQVKNTLYFYDVLVWAGEYLVGADYATRFAIVEQKVQKAVPIEPKDFVEPIYRATNIPSPDWEKTFELSKQYEHIEGLVLKRTGGVSRLTWGNQVKNNGGWMAKIRRPMKNYTF